MTRSLRRPPPLRVAGVLLSTALLTLSGCGSGAVEVDDFSVTPEGKDACQALLEDLPERVSDQQKREVTGSTFAAAYGDPALVVRCGVGVPEEFDKFSSCQRANGIDWFVEDLEAVVDDQSRELTMTLVGRAPALSVDLPGRYRPPVAAMIDLEQVVREHTRKTDGGCQG